MIVVIGPKAAVEEAPRFEFHQTLTGAYAELSLDDLVTETAKVVALNSYKTNVEEVQSEIVM